MSDPHSGSKVTGSVGADEGVEHSAPSATVPNEISHSSQEIEIASNGDKLYAEDAGPFFHVGPDALSNATDEDKDSADWTWGAAWSAFTGAVQQDVKEFSNTVKTALKTVRDELAQPVDDRSSHSEQILAHIDNNEPLNASVDNTADKRADDGFGVLDQQVDQLASAAGRAFGSLWTGIGGAINSGYQAASSVAGQIEQATLQASGNNGGNTKRGNWSTRSIKNRFLSGSSGTLVMGQQDGSQEDEWQVIDLLGSPATSVAASFEQLFKLYRGHRFVEELEAIGQEASRSCTRARKQLPDKLKTELDIILAETAAFVDLLAAISPSEDMHSAARRLIANVPSSADEGARNRPHQLPGGPREGLANMCRAAVDRADTMRTSLAVDDAQTAWEGLCRMRAEGLKLLAEFTALSLQHMAFLAMCLEGGDAIAAGLDFTADGVSKGVVVRGVVLQLLADSNAIFEAFFTALEWATEDEDLAAMLLDSGSGHCSGSGSGGGGDGPAGPACDGSGKPSRDASLLPNMALLVGELKGGLQVGVNAAVEFVIKGSKSLVHPICAPEAIRLDAESGLSAPCQQGRSGSVGSDWMQAYISRAVSGDACSNQTASPSHQTLGSAGGIPPPLLDSLGTTVSPNLENHESASGAASEQPELQPESSDDESPAEKPV